MEYSDTQIAAADIILKTLLERESYTNDYIIICMIRKQYGLKATFVVDMLIEDGLMARYGEAFFKLTSKGARAAKHGMKGYKRREMFWLFVDDANKIAPVIKAAYAVAGAIGGCLATLLFS